MLVPMAALFVLAGCAAAEKTLRDINATLGTTIEGNGDARAVALGQRINDAISPAGDVDEFVVDAKPGDEFNVVLHVLPNEGSRRNGTLRATVVHRDPVTQESSPVSRVVCYTTGCSAKPHAYYSERVRVPSEGTYAVRVEGSNSASDTAPYTILLQPVNRSPETGLREITAGQQVRESIDPVGDVDEYFLVGRKGDQLNLALYVTSRDGERINTDLHAVLMIADSITGEHRMLERVTCNAHRCATEPAYSQRVTLPADGTYLVRVEGTASASDAAPYVLIVQPVR